MLAVGLWLLISVPLCWASCPSDTACDAELQRCYKYVNEEIDFFSAEEICFGLGGHLVSIKNAFEAARVEETAKSMFVGLSDYWIGANDILTGNWSWTDGSPWGYTNWFPGGDSVDGAVYASMGSGLWTAASEGLSKPFVCGLPYVSHSVTQCPVCETCPTLTPTHCPSTASTPKVTCPACPSTTAAPKVTCPTTAAPTPCPRRPLCEDGWVHFGGTKSCYLTIHWTDFASAEQLCVSYGAHLTSIHSLAENNFVAGYAYGGINTDNYGEAYIGLHKVFNEWQWTDGTPVTYINWAAGAPNNADGELCVEIYTDGVNAAPQPYWKRCYKFVRDEIDFLSAEDICVGFGGHLTSIRNPFEGALVQETAMSMFLDQFDYWIGANHILNDYWSWTDGSTWNYTQWSEDDEKSEGGVCASLADGLWNATAEVLFKPFVCALPYVSQSVTQCPVCQTCPTTAAPTTCSRRALCDDGWAHFGQTKSCYKTIHHFKDAAAAEQMCVDNGGHLASIHSNEENEFVAEFASSGVTGPGVEIGLYKVPNGWQWTDGTPTTYINWGHSEPDNSDDLEACVEIYTDFKGEVHGKWNDIPCTWDMRAAVCKKAEYE